MPFAPIILKLERNVNMLFVISLLKNQWHICICVCARACVRVWPKLPIVNTHTKMHTCSTKPDLQSSLLFKSCLFITFSTEVTQDALTWPETRHLEGGNASKLRRKLKLWVFFILLKIFIYLNFNYCFRNFATVKTNAKWTYSLSPVEKKRLVGGFRSSVELNPVRYECLWQRKQQSVDLSQLYFLNN